MIKGKRIFTILLASIMISSSALVNTTDAFAASKSNNKKVTTSSKSSKTNVNPSDYINDTTIDILPASSIDISNRSAEFQGLTKDCTKVAYAYADPRENSNSDYNTDPEGSKSLAVYIFGYDNTTDNEFLNTKKYIPYILNKLYFNSKLKKTWYKTLTNGSNGIYIILEKPGVLDANEKFGNPTDGFGMRLISGTMENEDGAVDIMFHEMAHCIWDCSGTTNNFKVGKDPRTNIDYGTGNLITLWNKLYDDSIKTNEFYSNMYGWDYSHENFAEVSAYFFRKNFRQQLKENDPVVYNIMNQIYTQYNF